MKLASSLRWYNLFDLIIIGTSILETFVDILAKSMDDSTVDPSHLRIMRFLRLARALRGVRVMRLVRFIGALRSIVFAILSRSTTHGLGRKECHGGTLWSLLWTLASSLAFRPLFEHAQVLLVLLFYCFGVILAQLVSDHCRFAATDCDMSLRFWSSVPATRQLQRASLRDLS